MKAEWLYAVIGILSLTVVILAIRLITVRRSAREIARAFSRRLADDTNVMIDVSTRDRQMRRLACAINDQLRLLRKQRRQYLNGDRELKEAVTNISHDLRTPLTAICGYLELLERQEKSEAVERYVSGIANRVQALKQLTEEMFRYSVILSSEELNSERVNVNHVLEESIASFYAALTDRGITPEIDMTERQVVILGDRAALSRVFGNILNNAVKYSEGDLTIRSTRSGRVLFTNTARGLNEVQVGRLFERFFTVEVARNSTGLGLAISKTLVEQMGGTVNARYRNEKLTVEVAFQTLCE